MGLSLNYSLARFKSEVKAQTSSLSQQESGLIEGQLNELVHHSILNVRSILDRIIDDQYRMQTTVLVGGALTAGSVTSDALPVGTVYDLSKVSLYSATYKEVPIYEGRKFDAYKTVYSGGAAGDLAGKCIASIYNHTDYTTLIDFYCGTDTTFPDAASGMVLTHLRNVAKVTSETATVDLPDRWVPLAIDHCTLLVFRRFAKQPPADAEARVSSTATGIAQMLNANLNPLAG